jgi:hypothetical protein
VHIKTFATTQYLVDRRLQLLQRRHNHVHGFDVPTGRFVGHVLLEEKLKLDDFLQVNPVDKFIS